VDTDENGVVWLRGTAPTQEAADRAVAIARETEGVKDVRSHIKVRQDD
jgi:hyperosmotically inducible protein